MLSVIMSLIFNKLSSSDPLLEYQVKFSLAAALRGPFTPDSDKAILSHWLRLDEIEMGLPLDDSSVWQGKITGFELKQVLEEPAVSIGQTPHPKAKKIPFKKRTKTCS